MYYMSNVHSPLRVVRDALRGYRTTRADRANGEA